MANRRMFSRDICASDTFLDMPITSQRLYFFLGLFADDEGFLSSPKSILRQISANVDDLNILIFRGYVIPFSSGVIVITHWKQNNYLQNDRIKPTLCVKEKALLRLNSAKEYEKIGTGNVPYTPCIHSGCDPYTQYRVEEYREGEEDAHARIAPPAPPASEMQMLRENHQHAEQLIRRFGLPDNDPTLEAVLEDAQAHGWDRLEAALQTAALSNSRQKISVVFYRSILTAEPRKEQTNARADPYANYERF